MSQIEKLILYYLISEKAYCVRVIPYLKLEYFSTNESRKIFEKIKSFVDDYNDSPNMSVLLDWVDNIGGSQGQYEEVLGVLTWLDEYDEVINFDWMVDSTEKFCQDRAMHNGVSEIIEISQSDSVRDKHEVIDIMQKVLSVSFDNDIGHDFWDDAEKRWEYYNKKENKIPFKLQSFNDITNGGICTKTLNIILAGISCGKSLFMADWAAYLITQGYSVGYITCELSEEEVNKRIDANLLDISMRDVDKMPREKYLSKIADIHSKYNGILKTKEYPTSMGHSGHFRTLLDEWKFKKNFKPKILFIDYVNICASFRMGGGTSSYELVKAIGEELRGIAVERDIAIVSATQLNRSGFTNSDPGMENTSESFGLPAIADFMFALVKSEELDELDQRQVKQLKNRYNDEAVNRKFIIGIDKYKMSLYDINSSETPSSYPHRPVELPKSSGDKFSGIRL